MISSGFPSIHFQIEHRRQVSRVHSACANEIVDLPVGASRAGYKSDRRPASFLPLLASAQIAPKQPVEMGGAFCRFDINEIVRTFSDQALFGLSQLIFALW